MYNTRRHQHAVAVSLAWPDDSSRRSRCPTVRRVGEKNRSERLPWSGRQGIGCPQAEHQVDAVLCDGRWRAVRRSDLCGRATVPDVLSGGLDGVGELPTIEIIVCDSAGLQLWRHYQPRPRRRQSGDDVQSAREAAEDPFQCRYWGLYALEFPTTAVRD